MTERDVEKAWQNVNNEPKYVHAIAKKLLKLPDKSNAGWLARVKENQILKTAEKNNNLSGSCNDCISGDKIAGFF